MSRFSGYIRFPAATRWRSRHRCRPARARSGFTLLEVLVALAIFAMAAVVLGSAYLNVLNAYEVVSRGMKVNEDLAFARQLVLDEPSREELEKGGDFETAGGGQVRWTAEIEPSEVPDVYRVLFHCEISLTGTPEPQNFVETFMLLRPSWSTDAAEQGKIKEEFKRRIVEVRQEIARATGSASPSSFAEKR